MYPGCRAGLDLAQNSPLTVGLLVWGWALTVRGRPAWGGVLWGLLAFKPVWAVSFLAALLLLRQWRAALAMASTGAGLVLLTLPFVGVRAWLDWLHVGGLAAETYAIDEAWISLSRDLFGVPRRFLLDFRDGAAVNDRPAVALAGWALWLIVAGVTFAVVRASRSDGLRPPLAALVLLAAWLCTYRFMYYDSLVAALGVVVLLADPRPFFRREWWPVASWAVAFVGLMFAIENVTVPLRIEVTARVGYFNREVAGDDGHPTTTAPKVRFTSGDDYPWDTLAVAILWAWCVRTSWNSRKAEMGSAGDAAQSIKGGPDID